MARRSQGLATFDETAAVASRYADAPFDDGENFKAAARMFAGLGNSLGRLADKAAQRAGDEAGRQAGGDAIGLPETSVTDKVAPGEAPQPGLSAPGTGSPAPTGVMAEYIRAAATARGINPDVAIRVARAEGLGASWQSQLRGGSKGKREPSFGPFQLLTGGGDTGFGEGVGNRFQRETGLNPADPRTWKQNIDFALNEVVANGWGQWMGAAASGIRGRMGVGPNARRIAIGAGPAIVGRYQPASDNTPGLIEPGNIDLNNRPVVKNSNGTISTERSISVEIDGREVLIPTVSPDGKILSQDEAIALYKKSGKHLGIFKDATTANAYAEDLHNQQGQRYGGAAASDDALFQTRVPEPKPLALRRDGTIYGDAYDAALTQTAGWRMQAGLDAELAQAYDDFKDDPDAYSKQSQAIVKKYADQGRSIDETIGQAMEQRGIQRDTTYRQSIETIHEQRVDRERKDAALTSLQAAGDGIERQAYLIGAAEDGDERLNLLTQQALGSIQAALDTGAITPYQAAQMREKTVTSLVTSRIQGVFDALPTPELKQNFVKALPEFYKDSDDPISKLPPHVFRSLMESLGAQAAHAADDKVSSTAYERENFQNLIADDVASMAQTGEGVIVGGRSLDAGEVSRVVGPAATRKWIEARSDAQALHSATRGMERLPPDRIEARLKGLEPAPGEEGFAKKQELFEAAAKYADTVLKERNADPAKAADRLPEVASLIKSNAPPGAIAKARLTGQAALGIPDMMREPLTVEEARRMAEPMILYESDPEALDHVMKKMMSDAKGTYGENADEVMAQVLRVQGVDKETSIIGVDLMQRLGLGILPSPTESRDFQGARQRDDARKAMNGEKPVTPKIGKGSGRAGGGLLPPSAKGSKPLNAVHVLQLKRNPAMAADFDKRFGKGMAEKFLTDHGGSTRRVRADGATELVYEDGWIEVFNPDGSIEGRAQ